ncbi:hypothetical protein HU200_001826 [Digitaria exilis]|uniref:Transcription repressor n=1 Tax=Digitaria exilis TaxID=1010633 RepID=A0A835KZS5_9POAL|nr:hypothetical protein HU200_001826 [Digitaria exilis]
MKAMTRRGGADGGLPAANKKKRKKPPLRGFMCGWGGANSVSTIPRAAVTISAVTTPPILKATSAAASAAKKTTADDADASAEVTPSVDSLLQQLRELERGVRALGVRDHHHHHGREDGGGGASSRATTSRPRRRHVRSGSEWGVVGVGRMDAESVAVVTETEDPLGDFRRSMVQMIVENRITGGAELRELLRRFLSLNAACHHHLILRAFADVWEELFAGAGGHGARAPPPPHVPPAAEEKIVSYSSSSRATSSKRPPALLSR